MNELEIENREVSVELLIEHPRNYNKHNDAQIKKIMKSLEKHGQPRSVVVWDMPKKKRKGTYFVVAGNGVTEAARQLGWKKIRADILPTDYAEHLILSFLAADNELARQSDPDNAALALILDEITQVDPELMFAVGYDETMFDDLLASITKGAAQNIPQVVQYAPPPAVLPQAAPPIPTTPDRERMMATLNQMAAPSAPTVGIDGEPAAPATPAYDNPYVQLTFPCDMDQRTTVLTAVNRAKADFALTTSTQAILRICQFFLERQGP